MSIAANICEHRIRPWVHRTAVRVNFMCLHKRQMKANSYRKTCCHGVCLSASLHFNFLFLRMVIIQGNS